MKTRILFLVRHAMYNLRGGFLLRPLAIALTLGACGAVLSWTEETFPWISGLTPKVVFPSHDPQVAQVILGGIAASIMTVVSIVFAILLMTLTLASMQFSPRIIVSFSKDRVTQWTLGIFLGTFCYCLAALPGARSMPQPFAPTIAVMGAMFLVIVCVCWLLFFIHHISQAISVNYIVDRIAQETEAMIDELMPRPRDIYRARYSGLVDPGSWLPEVVNDISGYIRFVDIPRLVFLAKDYRVQVHLLRRVGQFVPAGVPLLSVSKGDRLSQQGVVDFRGAFDIGPTRTLQQDVEYGVLQIVDIALKAISPAVNDPTTGVGCVDQLSRILIRFASREPQEPYYFDPPGFVRVSIPWPNFDRLLESAYEQIRLYGKGDMAVSLRLLRALDDIAITTEDPSMLHSLVDQGRRVVTGCCEKLGEAELQEMRRRLAVLEKRAASPPAGTAAIASGPELSPQHSKE